MRFIYLIYLPLFTFYLLIIFQSAGLATHPFDVVKTHRQLELGESLFGS